MTTYRYASKRPDAVGFAAVCVCCRCASGGPEAGVGTRSRTTLPRGSQPALGAGFRIGQFVQRPPLPSTGGRELDRLITCVAASVCDRKRQRHRATWHAILHWQEEHSVLWHYMAPGKPQQSSLRAASRIIEASRLDYYTAPAHGARTGSRQRSLQPAPSRGIQRTAFGHQREHVGSKVSFKPT